MNKVELALHGPAPERAVKVATPLSELPRLTKPYRQEDLATVIDQMLTADRLPPPGVCLAAGIGRP